MSHNTVTKREAITGLGVFGVGARLVQGQEVSDERPPRLAPRDELVNVPEFEDMAKLKLDAAVYSTIAGGDRAAFDRMTLRPRMLVKSTGLDLSVELFGEKMFAPLLVGPISQQRQFHPDGELATVRGAEAAKAAVVISSRSSVPLNQIAAQTKTTLWYQVYPEGDTAALRNQMKQAVVAGCKAICITVGAHAPDRSSHMAGGGRPDWRRIDALRQGIDVPVLLKGVMTQQDARAAIERGVSGIVVSNGGVPSGRTAPIEVLTSIVEVVAGKVPVLIDGSFRRGSDVVKALALGAQAVMLGRPPMWGLAAYGAEGVQSVLEVLQTEVARTMVNISKPTIKMLDRSVVKIHGRP